MAVTLQISEDALARLRAEASRRGISVDQVVTELAAGLPADAGRRGLSFIGIGSSTTGRTAREADDLLGEGFGRD